MDTTRTFHSSSSDCQSNTCVICQRPFTQLCSTEMLKKEFSHQFVCCSPQCIKTLTHVTYAFVQGFMVSWVLCYCYYTEKDANCYISVGVNGHHRLPHIANSENDNHLAVMKESSEVRASVNGNSAVLPETECKLECQFEIEEHGATMPVHSETVLGKHFPMQTVDSEHMAIMKESNEVRSPVNGYSALLPEMVCKAGPEFEIEEHNVTMPVHSESDSFHDGSSDCHMKSIVNELEINTSVAEKFEPQSLLSVLDGKNSLSTISASPSSKQLHHSKKRLSHVLNGIYAKKAIAQQKLTADGDRSVPYEKNKQNMCSSCPYCNKTFSNKQLLELHTKSHQLSNCSSASDNQQSFTCEFCAQTYKKRDSLKAHIRHKHPEEEPVECDICGKVQPGTYALRAHKKVSHDFSKLCHICGAAFSGRSAFEKHLESHQGIKCYFCNVCGAGFVHRSSLNKHKAVHITTKSFQCDICSKVFKVQYLLNEHLLMTHQSGPSLEHRIRGLKKMGVEVNREAIDRHANHQCIVCGKLLVGGACPSHADNSQEIFHCPTCGESSSNIVLFYRHIKWHKGTLLSQNKLKSVDGDIPTGVPPSASGISCSVIKCEVCSKTLKSFQSLSTHMHLHREARFACNICNKRFTYKGNLKTHMNTHHGTWQMECKACQKKFPNKYALKNHQFKHIDPQFKCEVCGKAVTRRHYLNRHYQKMHPDYQQSI